MAKRYIQGVNKVQGANDGVAPASGYIGEIQTFTLSGQAFPTSGNNIDAITFQLPVGTWDVFGNLAVQAGTTFTVASPNIVFCNIGTASATFQAPINSGQLAAGTVSGGALFLSTSLTRLVVTSAATNYYFVVRINYGSNTGGTVDYKVYARRIA